jgi:hypothetical protein
MADKKVILEVELIEGNAQAKLDSLRASVKNLDKTHKDYKPTLDLITKAEKDLAKAQQNRASVEKGLASSTGKVDRATKRTAKEMKQLSSDTGASTSATLELGRVFSDAPYGMRGMANNIQQLASNLFFMSKKTDQATGKTIGFKGAIGSLLGGLVGPAGLLVVFQGVIALFDWYSTRSKKVKESTEAMSEGFTGLEKDLSALYLTQTEINDKIEDYIALSKIKSSLDAKKLENEKKLKEIAEELSTLDKKRESAERLKISNQKLYNDENDKESTRAKGYYKGVISNEEKLNKVTSKQNKLRQQEQEILGASFKELKTYREAKEALSEAQAGSLAALEKLMSKQVNEQKILSHTSEKYKELGLAIDETQKKIDLITGGPKKKGSGKDSKISPFKSPKELELDVKNNEKVLIDFNAKIEELRIKTEMNIKLSETKTEQERLDIKKLYATKLLTSKIDAERKVLKLNRSAELEVAKAKTAAHVTDIKRAFELFKIKTELRELNGEISEEQKKQLIGDATGKVFDSLVQANKEAKVTEEGIKERYKPILKVFEEVKEARFAALFSSFLGKGEKEGKSKDIEGLASYIEKFKQLASSLGDFIQAESERELTIEQNKTSALNQELNNRLLNENLSKDQRAAIQNQIAQNDEKLRLKQNKIKKKAFDTQKAFNISLAIANTVSAGISAANATYGGPVAKIAAMTAVIGAGLAQVAVISRQKFQPESANTPINTGAGGSGSGGRSQPSFNIVGRSNDNILLSAIQSQFDQPLRAYVVARDVTNQQQLDGVISSASGI